MKLLGIGQRCGNASAGLTVVVARPEVFCSCSAGLTCGVDAGTVVGPFSGVFGGVTGIGWAAGAVAGG
jgi:hypothetical protein